MKKSPTASKRAPVNTTYQAALLQTKAHRIIKQHVSHSLKDLGISSVHWTFLGLLYDSPKGARLIYLANELGVEAPFITALIQDLKDKKLIDYTQDPDDSRARIAKLNAAGKKFVYKTELYLQEKMRGMSEDIKSKEVLIYLGVLEKIINNSKK